MQNLEITQTYFSYLKMFFSSMQIMSLYFQEVVEITCSPLAAVFPGVISYLLTKDSFPLKLYKLCNHNEYTSF